MVSSQRRKGAKKEQLIQENSAPLRGKCFDLSSAIDNYLD
jgi:hypothetical protein